MYFRPKNGKNGQNKNFPDTTMQINDSKQLSPDSDQVLDKSDVRFRRKLVIFGLSALAERPMDARLSAWRPSVRPSVSDRISKKTHQILMIFCTKLHLDESKKMFQADF